MAPALHHGVTRVTFMTGSAGVRLAEGVPIQTNDRMGI